MYFSQGNYYKLYAINYSFVDMIDFLKSEKNSNHEYVGFLHGIYITKMMVSDPSHTFTMDVIYSNEWQILIIDYDMNQKRNEVQDYFINELNIDFDSRWYNPDTMSISDMYNYVNQHYPLLLTDDILYNIFIDLKKKMMLKPVK